MDGVDGPGHDPRRAFARLAELLFAFARERLGEARLRQAARAFGLPRNLSGDELAARFGQFFVPWLLYSWRPPAEVSREAWSDVPDWDMEATIAENYVREHEGELDELECRLLEAAVLEPFTFWEIVRADARTGQLELRDALRGGVRHSLDPEAARSLQVHDIAFGVVLASVGASGEAGPSSAPDVILALASRALPAETRADVLALRDELRAAHGEITDLVLEESHELLLEVHGLLESETAKRQARRVTVGGELLELHLLRYEIDDAVEAHAALLPLAAGMSPAQLQRSIRHDELGRFASAELEWSEPAAGGGGWQVVAHLRLSERTLEAEVSTASRAQRVRQEIARRLGDGARESESRVLDATTFLAH